MAVFMDNNPMPQNTATNVAMLHESRNTSTRYVTSAELTHFRNRISRADVVKRLSGSAKFRCGSPPAEAAGKRPEACVAYAFATLPPPIGTATAAAIRRG
jgi:hypothetical protein